MKGCPLRCAWCSNPESQLAEQEISWTAPRCINCNECVNSCPVNAIDESKTVNKEICIKCHKCTEVCYSGALRLMGYEITPEELLRQLEKDSPFYQESGGGLTLSGGEPLLQFEFAREVLKLCKERQINTVIETAGHVGWEHLSQVFEYTDLFLYDLKHIDPGKHKAITGVSNEIILRNLEQMAKHNVPAIVRIPLVKEYNCDTNNIKGLAVFLSNLPKKYEVHLLPYHSYGSGKYPQLGRVYPAEDAQTPAREELNQAKKILEASGLQVAIK